MEVPMDARALLLTPILAGLLAIPLDAGRALPRHETRFRLDDRGRVIVPAMMGGDGPFDVVLDTGSNASAVSDRVAERLSLSYVARSTVLSAGGTMVRGIVRLAPVVVGPAVHRDVLATVMPAEDLEVAARGIDGMLGQDFLGQLHYTLDYRRRVLVWDDFAPVEGTSGAGPSVGSVQVSLVPADGRYVAELPQNGIDEALRFVPDSGADSLVLFERPAGRLPAMTPVGGAFLIAGLTGVREARMMRLDVLRVGSLVLRNQRAVTVDRPEPDAPDVDGLLPLHHFSRVGFRSREQRLLVWP
jgi:predicted aspartyl protease